jgi:hypothetical protein
MFPICKSKLSFAEISDYWSRESHPPASLDEIQALLEGAFWLGEITGEPPKLTRLEVLKRLYKSMRNCDAPHILFMAPEDTQPDIIKKLDDGSGLLDMRPRVPIPSRDPEIWSDESCRPAFESLAETPSQKHYPEWLPGFCARKLTSDEFFSFVSRRGYPFPKFWTPPHEIGRSPELKPAPKQVITDEVRRVYNLAHQLGDKAPNINEIPKPVQARLKELGLSASARQIKAIAGSSEFKMRRREPGKTLRSEKQPPEK